MNARSGDVAANIHRSLDGPGMQILILTGAPDGYLAALARAAGVAARLHKSATPQTLIDTVRALADPPHHTAGPVPAAP